MKKIIFLIIFLESYHFLIADKCFDYRLTDGSEQIADYAIDSTGNWWIKTSPFSGQFRYILENYSSQIYNIVSEIKFSSSGNYWAFFGKTNTQWFLVTRDSIVPLICTEPGIIEFAKGNEELIYSYYENEFEKIYLGNRQLSINNRLKNYFYTDFYGSKFAVMGYRGNSFVLNINGKETEQFEKILPVGFWYNGEFMYCALSGTTWEIKLGDKTILDGYNNISEAKINFNNNVAGFLVKTNGGNSYGVMYSDEYREPLISKNFDNVYNLELHPFHSMMAFNASKNSTNLIILSNTEYIGGEFTSKPFFTHDGNEMYYFGCNIDCFINIAGIKYSQNTIFSLNVPYSHKPNSPTIGYTSSSALVVRHLGENRLYQGMMVDETTKSIYNWKKQRYEALGRINNKIYHLTCNF